MSLSEEKLEEVIASATAEPEVPEVVNKVFDIPELREMIIRRVIYFQENMGTFFFCRQKTAPSLRLVSKDWLLAVTNISKIDKQILFRLDLDHYNSLKASRSVQQKKAKLLDRFLNQFYSDPTSSWNKECRPFFKLTIREGFFRTENYNSLTKCLTKCGNEILDLHIDFPRTGGTLTCLFPPFALSALENLSMRFNVESFLRTNVGLLPGEITVMYTENISHFLNSLLNATTTLNEFRIHFHTRRPILPDGFHLLTLPTTISKLELGCHMTSLELGILAKTCLPSLSELKMYVPESPFSEGLIFQVLNTHKTTLENLHLFSAKDAFRMNGNQIGVMPFQLPMLSKLQVLKFSGIFCELENSNLTSLRKKLPALNELQLAQTETGFLKWTKSKFLTVNQLSFDIIRDPVLFNNVASSVSINLDTMKLLHRSFSNVTVLSLGMSGEDVSGLKYVFTEMDILKSFTLSIVKVPEDVESTLWDAVFTGVPREMIGAITNRPTLRGNINLENITTPSLRLLSNLENLVLRANENDRPSRDGQVNREPLISDLTFVYGFCKMPRLKTLKLAGRFLINSEITRDWEREKGSLTCSGSSGSGNFEDSIMWI